VSHDDADKAWKVRGISPSAKAVLLCLAYHRNGGTGRCHPKQQTIAAETGYGLATVKRAIAELEREKLVVVTRSVVHGMRANNSYRLTLPLPAKTAQGELSPTAHGELRLTAHSEPRYSSQRAMNQEVNKEALKPRSKRASDALVVVSSDQKEDAGRVVAPLPSSPSASPPSPGAFALRDPDAEWPKDATGYPMTPEPGASSDDMERWYAAKASWNKAQPSSENRVRLITPTTIRQLGASSR
jgi:hypothetical protein